MNKSHETEYLNSSEKETEGLGLVRGNTRVDKKYQVVKRGLVFGLPNDLNRLNKRKRVPGVKV